MSDPREMFVLKSGQWAGVAGSNKSNRRVILNARKMRFDGSNKLDGEGAGEGVKGAERAVEGNEGGEGGAEAPLQDKKAEELNTTQKMAKFTKTLVETALVLSPESSLENLVAFLDSTSALRSLDLSEIDFQSEAAVALFVNIYHALLQHALLLLGPPTKHSITHFMRCVCYEIGGDVFSLSELEYCVIRGRLGPPSHSRSFYVEPSKSSAEAFKMYALGGVDARVDFVLHTGECAGREGGGRDGRKERDGWKECDELCLTNPSHSRPLVQPRRRSRTGLRGVALVPTQRGEHGAHSKHHRRGQQEEERHAARVLQDLQGRLRGRRPAQQPQIRAEVLGEEGVGGSQLAACRGSRGQVSAPGGRLRGGSQKG